MPGEPVSRSIGFVIENKAELGKTWKAVYKTFLKPMFTKGTSVIAVNEKDEIVGKLMISFIKKEIEFVICQRYETWTRCCHQ